MNKKIEKGFLDYFKGLKIRGPNARLYTMSEILLVILCSNM